jgi:hypothetical protein
MIATVNGKLYGKPGVGIYDLSLQQLQDCCCGLKVESVEFELLDPSYDPFCLRQATGTPVQGCRPYKLTLAGATLLAADYLEESRYIAIGDTQLGRPCGFCEGSVYLFFLVGAVETPDGFIITFEAEDCSNADGVGIPPRDYLCTVTISRCG